MRCDFQPVELTSKGETNRIRASTSRASETSEKRDVRVEILSVRTSTSRTDATPEERNTRRETELLWQSRLRTKIALKKVAFNYNKDYDYKTHRDVVTGPLANLSFHCPALKFQKETPSLCCYNGNVNLPPLTETPEPFLIYIAGATGESKHFLDTNLEIKLELSKDIVCSD
ncbi:hypothetical protein NPIL_486981 [Nephila pilipes]|uniref:Uncharacterized protein n=1 Tax=Nephila pilipes TaxID=299642 RepID=A0A8X6P9U2_NEPPI|nr:hypothetical protein NPIL_486981 [Nephila pilipes]